MILVDWVDNGTVGPPTIDNPLSSRSAGKAIPRSEQLSMASTSRMRNPTRVTALPERVGCPSASARTVRFSHRYNHESMAERTDRSLAFKAALFAVLAAASLFALAACGSGSGSEQASGASFEAATSIADATFDAGSAISGNGAAIDVSHTSDGYVAVSAEATSRLKFQITSGQASYNYDLPQDGSAIVCPLSFGDGPYTFRVMQNTSGSNYVELFSTAADVTLNSEFEPFLHPNVYCNYSESSTCVAKARELVANAANQGEAVRAICEYVVDNVKYDDDKAAQLKDSSGYVPNPDDTLSSGTGICFDYASLGAAMLRSQGIPAKIVTGYVSPNGIYHAWIMVHIDGTWKSARFSVVPNTWSRVDLTFAASSDGGNVGDGKDYTDRFVY